MAIQGFFTGDVKIRDLNGVLKAVDGIVEVATDAGTVTSVGIQVGSTGTDVNVANSPVTTSGNITLNLPTASATNRGLLSSADWAIFDAKQGSITLTTTGNNGSATLTSGTLNIPTYTLAGLGGISLTSLSASSPLAYNNTTGAFSIQVANGSQNGYLSSSDWTTFNSKQSALTFSSPLVNTSGTISIPAATSSVNGYLTSTDWATFNNKQGAITLTTTGSSGAATLIGTTLNIPNYSGALTGYVPYTGATGNVDLGEYGISSGYFQADLTPSGTLQVGRMQWNSTDGTMDLRLMGNNVTLQIGQEQVARVVNGTGGNLLEANYQAVKIIGAQGQRLQVGLARADNDANSKDTLGLVTENINNNQEGFITVSGLVNEINTTGSLQGETWADGDTLYLSGTTSGAITNVKPTAPIHTVIVGFVVYAHANHGKIFVKVDNGYELEELHDVAPTPYVNKGVLYRDTATNLWKSATIGTLLGYTPANAATTLTINGTAYDLSANRTWNVGTVTSIGTSGPLTGGTITGSGTIGITQATTSTDGYLSSTDWNTFNNKQAAGNYITALTGEATASGPGSASVTLSTSAVTGKLLTGLNLTGGGSIAATDSILQAFGKVQNQISGLAGGVTYQGTWNASTNTPTLTSSVGTKGYYYIVDVAGSTNLNGITDWKIGDWAIFNGSTWDKVDNTDAVSSVNGFTGAVSLTTSNIAEGTNLYYLDSRARLALSFTAGSGAYDNTTGVITIPTNTSQLTNGANFITLSSLSASSPLSYNNVSGAFSIQVANGSQNGYLSSSDWTTFNSKQAALTLTTTGSSGSSTLVGATLNVPTYTLSGLGGVPTSRTLTINGTSYDLSSDRTWSVGTITGTGTSNYLPKWQSSSVLGDSLVYDASTAILIGTTTASTAKFMVYSATADNHYQAIGSAPSFRFADTITSPTYTGIIGLATASNHFIVGAAAGDMVLANNTTSSLGNFIFGTGTTERMRITPDGSVLINTTSSGGYRFNVNGTVYFSSTSYTNGIATFGSSMGNGLRVYGGSGSSQWDIYLNNANLRISQNSGSGLFAVDTAATFGGSVTATSIIRSGGTSSQYLMADGSVSTLTNPVTGTGTTNYLTKFTGTSSIGNSATQTDSTGNLMVGSANSGNAGTINVSVGVAGTTAGGLQLWAATNQTHFIQFGDGTTGAQVYAGYMAYAHSSDSLIFGTNGADKMFLNASGNLGLGVTPSGSWASDSASKVLEFSGGSVWSYSTSQMNLLQNAVFNGSNLLYVNSASASAYRQISGAHIWYQAPSGTAGNAISFTQAMTLNASGELLVGTTSLATGFSTYAQFEVSGSTGGILINSATNNIGRLMFTNNNASGGEGLIRYDGSNKSMQFWTNASEGMRLSSSGNLSIGNTNDTYKLDVTGQIRVNGSTNEQLILDYTTAVGGFSWQTFRLNGVNKYRLVGNVDNSFGIYSDLLSAYTLTIASTGAATFSSSITTSGGGFVANMGSTNTEGLIIQRANTSSNAIIKFRNNATDTWILGNRNTGDETFRLYNYNVGSDVLTVTNGGSVGIGTTSPASRLHVSNTGGSLSTLTDIIGRFNATTNTAGQGSGIALTAIATKETGVILGAEHTSGNNGDFVVRIYNGGADYPERMRITSGGNVGFNTSTPTTYSLSGSHIENFGSSTYAFIHNNTTSVKSFLATNESAGLTALFTFSNHPLTLGTNNTERMRITSGGNVLVGTTSLPSASVSGFCITGTSSGNISSSGASTSAYNHLLFYNGNGLVGYISTSGSTTTYSTSSDYRLKTDFKDFSGLDLVSKIKTYDYEWKSDKSRSYGVIAHELQSVINYAVTGIKDGEQMQGVDYSKIVPVLIKAVQESHDIIKELKQKVEILESK